MNIEYSVKEMTMGDLKDDLKGFLETLRNLSETGEIKFKDAKKFLSRITSQEGHIYIAKNKEKEIIGTTTLIIEQKFIHHGGKVGHIEDVATRGECQGNGIASELIRAAIIFAKQRGCYKIILDCNDDNIPFYKRLGFYKHENEMRFDLK